MPENERMHAIAPAEAHSEQQARVTYKRRCINAQADWAAERIVHENIIAAIPKLSVRHQVCMPKQTSSPRTVQMVDASLCKVHPCWHLGQQHVHPTSMHLALSYSVAFGIGLIFFHQQCTHPPRSQAVNVPAVGYQC